MLVGRYMGVMRAHVHACRIYGHACVYLCISYLPSPYPPPPTTHRVSLPPEEVDAN